MQQTQQRQNGHKTDDETTEILDELGLQEQILSGSDSNPLLRETNLGLGNYSEDYKWQQVRSYRKGLYAWIAFGRVLTKRKLFETKFKLGREGYNPIYSKESQDVKTFPALEETSGAQLEDQSTWSAAIELGERRWRRLGDPHEVLTEEQVSAIMAKTGISEEWQPLFWELVSGRHEVSRSEDAELIRDALTGIKHLRDESQEQEKLLG